MPSLNPFRRQHPDRPTLRQRAAELKARLTRTSRSAEPTPASKPVVGPAVTEASILSRIAQHRIARDRWIDSVMPGDRAWRLQHGQDVSAEAVAAAEAERDAADALVTARWNSLFETPPASSAELLALLRHAQHFVDEDHAPAHDAADRIIAVLDRMDGDTDLEDGGETEPSLAAPENHAGSQVVWMRGNDADCEAEAPEVVLPEVVAETLPEAAILPWRGRGNVIAAAGTLLLDLLERA